jgi:hypothetical protein
MAGRPDWAIFRLLGDQAFYRLFKITKLAHTSGLHFYSVNVTYE